RVTALEKKLSDFEQKSQTLDNTTQNLGSRVYTLELRDLPHKINQIVNEVVKEAIQRTSILHIFPRSRHDWLKPLPEEDRPETPELDWIIPPTDLPEAKNNWADALAKSYKDPEENK
nr:hypothetical protein [Tanacetum cinerariifolium]